jgi:hypothetical protein
MSHKRAKIDRPGDAIDHSAAIVPAGSLPTSIVAGETREARKRAIAKRILPFFKEIAQTGSKIQTTYDRQKLELIVEACRDYLMAEAEADPELTFDEQLGIAEIVSGIAKGWTFARELLDKGGAEKLIPLYVVLTEKIEEIADAIDIRVVYRPPGLEDAVPVGVTREVLDELIEVHAIEPKNPSRTPEE